MYIFESISNISIFVVVDVFVCYLFYFFSFLSEANQRISLMILLQDECYRMYLFFLLVFE